MLQFSFFIFLKIVIIGSLKDAILIFTDGLSNRRLAYIIDDKWYVGKTDIASAQIVELQTVAIDFQIFASNAFYLYTHNQYTFRTLQVIENYTCTGTSNSQIRILF